MTDMTHDDVRITDVEIALGRLFELRGAVAPGDPTLREMAEAALNALDARKYQYDEYEVRFEADEMRGVQTEIRNASINPVPRNLGPDS